MNPEMKRLCEALETVMRRVGRHTVTGRTEDIVRIILMELREASEDMRTAGQEGHRAFDAMAGAGSPYLSSEPYSFAAMIDHVLTEPANPQPTAASSRNS
jgi:hypothetical protein